jgi:mannose-6-phosphate isomerase-like protein (cupin superfamily)
MISVYGICASFKAVIAAEDNRPGNVSLSKAVFSSADFGDAYAEQMNKTSLAEKFALIHEHWRPKVVAQLNGQEVKLVKFKGVFPWHHHEHEDELFLVWRGEMTIEFRDGRVTLQPGELCVVPCGVEHRTVADAEAELLIFEPAQTRNTGNIVSGTFTAPNGVKI